MKSIGILSLILMVAAPQVHAVTVEIDPGNVGDVVSIYNNIPFSDLNGIELNGQSLTIDYIFPSPKLLEIVAPTSLTSGIALFVGTDLTSPDPDPPSVSGSFLDTSGQPFPPAPSSLRKDTVYAADVVTFGLSMSPILDPYVFSGVRYEVVFPDINGAVITSGNFSLHDAEGEGESFTVIPEPSTLSLVALSGLLLIRRMRRNQLR